MYSKTKLYQKTVYEKQRIQSYDRLLKEANLQGSGDPKESMLEKPYKSKTYSQMQQEYNQPLPPTIDPGAGTGGLKCLFTSTGCEQLVGCWAGSDIVITGPEANTAGYLEPTTQTGEIIKWEVSGSENRGIDLTFSPIPARNTVVVRFKDGMGVVHETTVDIECATFTPISVFGSSNILDPGNFFFSDELGIGDGIQKAEGSIIFQGVPIPPGSTVTSAVLNLYGYGTRLGRTVRAVFKVDEVDDAAIVLDYTDFYTKSWSAITVSWEFSDNLVGTFPTFLAIDTPNLATLIQLIVDRPGWTYGNKIQLGLFNNSGDDTFAYFPTNGANSCPIPTMTLAF